MDKKYECLCSHEIKVPEYCELLGMRYGDVNANTQRI